MNEEVNQYIAQADQNQGLIMEYLRGLIHELVPGVTEEFKWSRPVFKSKQHFAYFKTTKKHLTLGFYCADKLDDPHQLLEGSGKGMCHVKIQSIGQVDDSILKKWILAAAE